MKSSMLIRQNRAQLRIGQLSLQRWVNIEEDPCRNCAAEDIQVFEEICAEFDNMLLQYIFHHENNQQSSSDTSIILDESEPAFDGVNALAQIIDSTMKFIQKPES